MRRGWFHAGSRESSVAARHSCFDPTQSTTDPRMSRLPTARALRPRTAAVAVLVCAALQVLPGIAAESEVIAPDAIVRSAPFDVAPELARVHVGDKLPADDQAQGAWRRVRLPDGRHGFLRDVDAKVVALSPPVPGLPPQTPAAEPDDPAPFPLRPATSTGLPAPAPQGETQRDNTQKKETQTPEPPAAETLFGVMFGLLPVGNLRGTSSNGMQSSDVSGDSFFAVAVATFLDVAASPYFAIGASPQVIFRVKSDGSTGPSATEFDLRGRLTGRLPMSPTTRVYGRLSPAYSIISFPTAPPNVRSVPNPQGFMVDFSVGAEVALLPKLFVVVDLGYQLGFQSSSQDNGGTSFDGSRYLHIGGGLAIAL